MSVQLQRTWGDSAFISLLRDWLIPPPGLDREPHLICPCPLLFNLDCLSRVMPPCPSRAWQAALGVQNPCDYLLRRLSLGNSPWAGCSPTVLLGEMPLQRVTLLRASYQPVTGLRAPRLALCSEPLSCHGVAGWGWWCGANCMHDMLCVLWITLNKPV